MRSTIYIRMMALCVIAMVLWLQAPAQPLAKSYPLTAPTTPFVVRPVALLPPPVPADHHTRHFGFFCRQELRMQQKKLPMQFRLGSADQCNTLEGKPGYR